MPEAPVDIVPRVSAQRGQCRDLPEGLVQAARTEHERAELLRREVLETGDFRLALRAVDPDRALPVVDGEVDLVAVHVLGHLDDGDSQRARAPDVLLLAQGERMVRRVEQAVERVGERSEGVVREVVVGVEGPVWQRDEVGLVSGQVRCDGGQDGVPLPGSGNPVDACDPPQRMLGVDRGQPGRLVDAAREVEATLPGELLVERLLPAEETQRYCGSISP